MLILPNGSDIFGGKGNSSDEKSSSCSRFEDCLLLSDSDVESAEEGRVVEAAAAGHRNVQADADSTKRQRRLHHRQHLVQKPAECGRNSSATPPMHRPSLAIQPPPSPQAQQKTSQQREQHQQQPVVSGDLQLAGNLARLLAILVSELQSLEGRLALAECRASGAEERLAEAESRLAAAEKRLLKQEQRRQHRHRGRVGEQLQECERERGGRDNQRRWASTVPPPAIAQPPPLLPQLSQTPSSAASTAEAIIASVTAVSQPRGPLKAHAGRAAQQRCNSPHIPQELQIPVPPAPSPEPLLVSTADARREAAAAASLQRRAHISAATARLYGLDDSCFDCVDACGDCEERGSRVKLPVWSARPAAPAATVRWHNSRHLADASDLRERPPNPQRDQYRPPQAGRPYCWPDRQQPSTQQAVQRPVRQQQQAR